LLDLGRVWNLTFYGFYRLGQLWHESEEIGAQVHSFTLTKTLGTGKLRIYKHALGDSARVPLNELA